LTVAALRGLAYLANSNSTAWWLPAVAVPVMLVSPAGGIVAAHPKIG